MAQLTDDGGLVLHGLSPGWYGLIKYERDATTCIHGNQSSCDRCYSFAEDLITPSFEAKPAQPIAKTYPPDMGDPQELFYNLEGIAEYLLMKVAGLDNTNPQEQDTPARWVRALRDMTTSEPFNFTTFEVEGVDEMVIEKNIPFSSLCRHHILPFTGVAHIGYIPSGTIAGLSKIPRTVSFFARKLQTQEELTRDIALYLEEKLHPLGVAVVMEAEHSCMALRGARAPGVTTSSQVMKGVFANHERTAKAEFLSRINNGK